MISRPPLRLGQMVWVDGQHPDHRVGLLVAMDIEAGDYTVDFGPFDLTYKRNELRGLNISPPDDKRGNMTTTSKIDEESLELSNPNPRAGFVPAADKDKDTQAAEFAPCVACSHETKRRVPLPVPKASPAAAKAAKAAADKALADKTPAAPAEPILPVLVPLCELCSQRATAQAAHKVGAPLVHWLYLDPGESAEITRAGLGIVRRVTFNQYHALAQLIPGFPPAPITVGQTVRMAGSLDVPVLHGTVTAIDVVGDRYAVRDGSSGFVNNFKRADLDVVL